LEGPPTSGKGWFGREQQVPEKELRDMRFGQILSQNVTKIRKFEPCDRSIGN
jgi:hypothetical protein